MNILNSLPRIDEGVSISGNKAPISNNNTKTKFKPVNLTSINDKKIENKTGLIEHSIFSDVRKNELQNKLKSNKSIPVVCAWGVSSDLDPLIERCINQISYITEPIGLLKKGTKNKYFHPLPTLQTAKVKWVSDMVEKLKS